MGAQEFGLLPAQNWRWLTGNNPHEQADYTADRASRCGEPEPFRVSLFPRNARVRSSVRKNQKAFGHV